jgi:hypothetical protein
MNPDLQTFLQAWTGGADVSDVERARLLQRLETDAEFRGECVKEIRLLGLIKAVQTPSPRWLNLHNALGLSGTTPAENTDVDLASRVLHLVHNERQKPANVRWLSWRPLTAAAAGLVIGLFSATMVFAYAVPRMMPDRQRVVSFFDDGFEDASAAFGRGFPRDAGGWSGDHLEVVEAGDGKSPKEGLRMVRLAPVKERKFCAAVRIMDLAEFPPGSETESITVEVTASFHGMESEWQDRNQIRLAAFAEPPADVRHIWRTDGSLEQALLHVARTIETKPGDRGWQTLHASMVIPAGTRSLVIHLGASIAEDSAPKSPHFLDDVQVRFTAHEVPLP